VIVKITKRFVEILETNRKDTDNFDDTLQGCGVRDRVSGRQVSFGRHRTRLAQSHVIGVLPVMLAQPKLWGLQPESCNSCRGIKKFKEEKREQIFVGMSETQFFLLAKS
jgi:hypothetical protein